MKAIYRTLGCFCQDISVILRGLVTTNSTESRSITSNSTQRKEVSGKQPRKNPFKNFAGEKVLKPVGPAVFKQIS